MYSEFKGKTVIVTGSASGIGRHTALSFAKEGANVVVVTAHSVKAAEETVAEIKALGAGAIFVQCDVSNEQQVEAMVAKAVEAFGSVDIAFNNAGVGPDGVTIPVAPITEVAESDWDWVVDTNLKGVFLCMKHELRQMRKQGSGCIVNTSSDAGLGAMGNFGGYCPSKAGNNMISVCAAIENVDKGIRVNVVCPGPTAGTGMLDRLMSSRSDESGGPPPMASVNDVDDVARVVLWLCSDEASRVNGSVIAVGGRLGVF